MGAICKVGRRCHTNAKAMTTWGSDFPAAMVKQISSSSGLLIVGSTRMASGTLIWSNVLLAAGHSFKGIEPTSVEVMFGYQLPAGTAPNGDVDDNSGGSPWRPLPRWTAGAPTVTPQAKVAEILEHDLDLDIVFARLEWKDVVVRSSGVRIVALPRPPVIPRPGLLNGKQIAAVGHPWDTSIQAEPTQVMASAVRYANGPHHLAASGAGFTYYEGEWRGGWSGGGVFNTRGEVIGVALGGRGPESGPGRKPYFGTACANLGAAASAMKRGQVRFEPSYPRIRQWLGGGSPLMQGEQTDNVIVTGPQGAKEQPAKQKR